MPVTPDPPVGALDPRGVMRHSYVTLVRRLGARLGIFGALLITPLILVNLGVPNSFWLVLPSLIGFIGLLFVILHFVGHPFRLRKCGKVLHHYPLRKSTVTRVGKPIQTHNLTFYILDVTSDDGGVARMRGVEPQGLNRWPKAAEEGAFFAGDPPFGGVIVVPGSKRLFLVRPDKWDDAAPARNAASPSRIERAKKAGIELIPF
jgi:hypothetical protein